MASLIACVGLFGCARYPATTLGQTPGLLFVTFRVEQQINPAYYYFVALQASPNDSVQGADPTEGPFAIARASTGNNGWGNGWGTGRITDYVMYHAGQASQYSIDTSDPTTTPAKVAAGGTFVGPPFSTAAPDASTLTVAVTLTSLGQNGMANTASTRVPGGVVVNVITTDHLEQNIQVAAKPTFSLEGEGLPQLDLHQDKSVDLSPTSQVEFGTDYPAVNSADLRVTHVTIEARLGG